MSPHQDPSYHLNVLVPGQIPWTDPIHESTVVDLRRWFTPRTSKWPCVRAVKNTSLKSSCHPGPSPGANPSIYPSSLPLVWGKMLPNIFRRSRDFFFFLFHGVNLGTCSSTDGTSRTCDFKKRVTRGSCYSEYYNFHDDDLLIDEWMITSVNRHNLKNPSEKGTPTLSDLTPLFHFFLRGKSFRSEYINVFLEFRIWDTTVRELRYQSNKPIHQTIS